MDNDLTRRISYEVMKDTKIMKEQEVVGFCSIYCNDTGKNGGISFLCSDRTISESTRY